MRTAPAQLPNVVPILSRGKHRSARKGACFMEMASYLAGERWSDHPRCTHPLLASVARLVNDLTSDEHRQRLANSIPDVIGMTTGDPRVGVHIAWRCATAALPIARAELQNTLAVAVLAAERTLADLEQRPFELRPTSAEALSSAPDAARWARAFTGRVDASVQGFLRHGAPSTVRVAVPAIAEACVPDADDRLHHLLLAVIADCTALCRPLEPTARACRQEYRRGRATAAGDAAIGTGGQR